jgi:chromosome segregation ATPase
MSEEKPNPTSSAMPLSRILAYVGIAAVFFGAGMALESQFAAHTAAAAKQASDQEMKDALDKVNHKADEEKQALTDTLDKERKEHEKAIQAKDKSLAAVSNRAAGVRHALEADLSAARTSGDACLSRITRISEALDGVFDSVGEVAGLAKDLGRENEQLKTDNKELADKLAGWQKWNTERNQRIIVNAQKGG